MKIFCLGGEWNFKRSDNKYQAKGEVPGDIYADLLRNKMIPDPYYRTNEDDVQWVGESDWIYSRSFTLPKTILEAKKVILKCEGLDTFAIVRLNGKEVASTDNMFRSHEWDVKKLLRPGTNQIEVYFKSVIPYARERQEKHYLPCWGVAPTGYDENWVLHKPHKVDVSHGWIRKEQCNFGWDWGPKVVTCGIWRDISIVAIDDARISDVMIGQEHKKDGVKLTVSVDAENVSKEDCSAKVTVLLRNRKVAEKSADLKRNSGKFELQIEKPELWWPNGMGKQPLYTIDVELIQNKKTVDSASRRIGLRVIKLDQAKDKWGNSFTFNVNGIPFFAKGANWIPADGVLANLPESRYRVLLEDAVKANMNFIRLWGGGIYEHDIFYDLCDELGLMIWHDFMFACSTYPAFDDSFIETVRKEVRDNVTRIRHHPSIALWCGNNELEQGLVGDEWTKRTMSWEDYKKLFDKAIPEVLKEVDPAGIYWPCSPHTPIGDRRNFNDPTVGDAHLWDVWHGKKPYEWYRTCKHRFVSEFGFQSFNEPKTTYSFTKPEDRNITSYVMEHHQRSDIGNSTIMHYMLDWFRLPSSFENTLWASQILQGMAIKYAVEHWRRNMPQTMGTIYWQINDTWPGPSWSSIDYYCRWKALHYIARKFYEPLMISGVEKPETGEVEIHITSDLLRKEKLKACYEVTDVAGNRLESGSFDFTAQPQESKMIRTLSLVNIIAKHSTRGILVWLSLKQGGRVISDNLVLFERPKYFELRRPKIKCDVKAKADNSFSIRLESNVPALWTWIELDKAEIKLSDNFFHLRKGAPVTITLTTSRKLTVPELKKHMKVRSLFDTY